MSIILTDQQKKIIESAANYNLVIQAVAGSGKTSTAFEIAKYYSDKKFMIVTYNRDLKAEILEKAIKSGLKNLDVQNYHSLCKKYYQDDALTDEKILEVLQADTPIQKWTTSSKLDYLILDEVQDMNCVRFHLIKKFIKDINQDLKLIVLGDEKQTLYEYQGSDARYLSLASKIFPSKYKWKHLKLTTSFRITKNIAKFLNLNYFNNSFKITAKKSSKHKVEYISFNPYESYAIKNYLAEQINEFEVENSIIIANSTNSEAIKKLYNYLSDYKKF
ncbi:hypothetical protein SCLARK_001355 [Spiroplasma clarkii]|uniref:UvrD-helicase domain-containing protein n=1 Tax=Spiroplasma clarkii TaxID=2139 RepID=UPI000B554C88|nr:UvrD-helicase domain-containing protein [Spiroplasma clarkii]ARU91884.1 hypothetical protein SCLARK_001355 [Spiroplasma clarkii]